MHKVVLQINDGQKPCVITLLTKANVKTIASFDAVRTSPASYDYRTLPRCKYILASASEPIPHQGFTCVHPHNTDLIDHCLPLASSLTTSALYKSSMGVVHGRTRFETVEWITS